MLWWVSLLSKIPAGILVGFFSKFWPNFHLLPMEQGKELGCSALPGTKVISGSPGLFCHVFHVILHQHESQSSVLWNIRVDLSFKGFLKNFSVSPGTLHHGVILGSSMVAPSRLSCSKLPFSKVSEITKGNGMISTNIWNFQETQNPARQKYFCMNPTTTDTGIRSLRGS